MPALHGMLDVFPRSFHFRSMKRKRIVVMGFMGSMPIAGVIWQHIHYIVGLQRLGDTSSGGSSHVLMPPGPSSSTATSATRLPSRRVKRS